MEGATFTESEVNRLLGEQKVNVRLDSLATEVRNMKDEIVAHMNKEELMMGQIKDELDKEIDERRTCKESLRDEMHNDFVKKKDLFRYTIIIIAAVTMTTGFITWIGAQSTKQSQSASIEVLAERIEAAIGSRTP